MLVQCAPQAACVPMRAAVIGSRAPLPPAEELVYGGGMEEYDGSIHFYFIVY